MTSSVNSASCNCRTRQNWQCAGYLISRITDDIVRISRSPCNKATDLAIMNHRYVMLTVILFSLGSVIFAQPSLDSLEEGFQNPPRRAQPRTFWHWTGGNITREGVVKDLEWMHRAGIGGAQIADVAFGAGQSIDRRVPFGSPEWLDYVRLAASKAQELGLELSIFSSAGWSIAGGPWVEPAEAMKKVVWSDTTVEGSRSFDALLPSPPSNNGPFQNMTGQSGDETYYKDIATIAYRTPPARQSKPEAHPEITTASGPIGGRALMDHDYTSAVTITAPNDSGPAWVLLAFSQPFHARALTIAARNGIPFGRVSVSEDGSDFQPLVTLPGPQNYRAGNVQTYAFPETEARYFKLEITGAAMSPAEVMAQPKPQPDSAYALTELRLHPDAYVNRWEDKAGYYRFLFDYTSSGTPPFDSSAVINPASMIDLTSQVDSSGRLHWQVPAGRWTILRLGYSLTGAKNRPPRPNGLGYEVDKLNPRYVRNYLQGYFDPLSDTLGRLFGDGLSHMTLDSWEAGMQNWTDGMIEAFRQRRGYDPAPYLPVLTGHVVGSSEISDRFLWDFRRTLADMFAENFYGVVTDYLHERGLKTYGEASGVSLEILEDALLNKKNVDIPMGEFWVNDLHPRSMYYVDVRGAASAAHVYGKPYVATESFTGGDYEAPYTLKQIADYWFTQGVNRIVFHSTALQPLDTRPGNTMVGTHINRNMTWAELAEPFTTYISRISYMLQQGDFVADVAYLLKEGAPSSMPFWGAGLTPAPPVGYDYDYVNTDILLHDMSVDSAGRIVLSGGMIYHVLVLPDTRKMTVPVIRKIQELVKDGATIVGPRPVKSPSLSGYPEADREIQSIADSVWGDLDGINRTKYYYGKGRIIWGLPLSEVLSMIGVPQDVTADRLMNSDLSWIHRRVGNTDLYYLSNDNDHPQNINVRFRVSGKNAEIWHPDDGTIDPAEYRMSSDFTTVSLHLSEHESVFVVFSGNTPDSVRKLLGRQTETVTTIKGPWEVSFPPDLGAPSTARFTRLQSWTTHANEGIQYFSGTATYRKTFLGSRKWLQSGQKLVLDLGGVKDIAQVTLNGKSLGILWKPPYQVDITNVLKPGTNRLQVEVTNQWTNRLVGDRSLPDGEKILTSEVPRFGPPRTLKESGLLGPVIIHAISEKEDGQNNK